MRKAELRVSISAWQRPDAVPVPPFDVVAFHARLRWLVESQASPKALSRKARPDEIRGVNEAAARAGLKSGVLSKALRGPDPTVETAWKVAHGHGVRPAWLAFEDGQRDASAPVETSDDPDQPARASLLRRLDGVLPGPVVQHLRARRPAKKLDEAAWLRAAAGLLADHEAGMLGPPPIDERARGAEHDRGPVRDADDAEITKRIDAGEDVLTPRPTATTATGGSPPPLEPPDPPPKKPRKKR